MNLYHLSESRQRRYWQQSQGNGPLVNLPSTWTFPLTQLVPNLKLYKKKSIHSTTGVHVARYCKIFLPRVSGVIYNLRNMQGKINYYILNSYWLLWGKLYASVIQNRRNKKISVGNHLFLPHKWLTISNPLTKRLQINSLLSYRGTSDIGSRSGPQSPQKD